MQTTFGTASGVEIQSTPLKFSSGAVRGADAAGGQPRPALQELQPAYDLAPYTNSGYNSGFTRVRALRSWAQAGMCGQHASRSARSERVMSLGNSAYVHAVRHTGFRLMRVHSGSYACTLMRPVWIWTLEVTQSVSRL